MQTLETLRFRNMFVVGTMLWWKHLRAFAVLMALFTVAEGALELFMRYGLYGTFSPADAYSPTALFESILPWGEPQRVLQERYTGPLGNYAGIFGILSGIISYIGGLALLRALSLAFHGHGVPLRDCVRTSIRSFPAAFLTSLRQGVMAAFLPLVVLASMFLLGGALRVFQDGATFGTVIARIADVSQWVGVIGFVVLFAYLGVRVAFSLPALIDQGTQPAVAVDESKRIVEGAWLFAAAGLLTFGFAAILLESVFYFATGLLAGRIFAGLDAAAAFHMLFMVVAATIVVPLTTAWWYVLYRNLLTVRGGAVRRTRAGRSGTAA